MIAADKFIMLKASDRQLGRFVGVDPAQFVHHMRDRRNAEVDQLIVQHLHTIDPMARYRAKTLSPKVRNQVDAADLAPVITLEMPAIHGERLSAPPTSIKVITELMRVRAVFCELTPATLTYIRTAAVHHHKNPGSGRKRTCRKIKTCSDAKGVLCDKRRKCVWLMWAGPDPEAPARRVARRPDQWDEFHINLCARELAADRDAGFPDGVGANEEALSTDEEARGADEEAHGVDAMGAAPGAGGRARCIIGERIV